MATSMKNRLLKIISLSIIFAAFCSQALSQIVLSEIMFDPVGTDYYDEFIEIFNLSPTDTIDLTAWKISDGLDSDLILAVKQGSRLKPKQFAIILDAGYFSNSTRYDPLIPSDALILTIDDAAFGSNGLANTIARPIILISSTGDTVATYWYSLDNPPGYSDEKINLAAPDSIENWANSRVLNGTPGAPNSVSLREYNVRVELQASPAEAQPAQPINLIALVINIGYQAISNIRLTFYEDINNDSLLTKDEQIGEPYSISAVLKANESYQMRHLIDSLSSGVHRFFVLSDVALDQDTSDNRAETIVKIGFRPKVVIINEIMYRPTGQQPEWFELMNLTDRPIDLRDWQFSDANPNQKFRLIDQNFELNSKGFAVIAENADIFQHYPIISLPVIVPIQGFPALNNSGDAVIIYDPIGTIIDQVQFQPSWGNEPGLSLERKDPYGESNDPANWGPSEHLFGATPGIANSISPAAFDLELARIQLQPQKPFAGDTVALLITIVNIGQNAISHFQLDCFIDWNRDTLFQEEERIGEPVVVLQGLAPKQSIDLSVPFIPLWSGCYLCRATVSSEQDVKPANDTLVAQLSVGFRSGDLVINEIMYSPEPGQPEWLELFNPSNRIVDIQNWSISDADSATKITLIHRSFPMAPQSFLVISADYSILNWFDMDRSSLIEIKSLPRFNDDADQIYLFDPNQNLIDVVSYRSSWGGAKGISLERINPLLSSQDSSNWSSCAAIAQGGTPGSRNSIFVDILPSEADLTIAPNPFSPDGDGRDDVTIITYRLPFNLSHIHVKIFDIRGRQVRFLVNNQPSGTTSSLIWDGRDDQGRICRIGIYIVYLEAIHYQRGVVKSLKKTVALGKQL